MSLEKILHADEDKSGGAMPAGGLEKKIEKKGWSFWDYVGMTATTAIGYIYGGGLLNLLATTGSYVIGTAIAKKGKMSKEDLKHEVNLGNLITAILYPAFKLLDLIPNPIAKAAAGLAFAFPVVNAAVVGGRYAVRELTPPKIMKRLGDGSIARVPGEIYKTFKDDYGKVLKTSYLWSGLPFAAVINFVPLQYQLPAMAGVRTLYRATVEKAMEDKAHNNAKTEKAQPYQLPRMSPKYAV
ncbi:MAG: Mpv17/PMP22 family protein [Nanoarchaeota archaeon]